MSGMTHHACEARVTLPPSAAPCHVGVVVGDDLCLILAIRGRHGHIVGAHTHQVVDLVEGKQSDGGVDIEEHRQQGKNRTQEWEGLWGE